MFSIANVLTVVSGIFCMIALDALWLGVLTRSFLAKHLEPLGTPLTLRLFPAFFVYVALSIGILVFVLPRSTSMQGAALYGALFGAIVYAIYELTNYAFLEKWSLALLYSDIVWGAVLCTVTTIVMKKVFSAF